MHAQSECRDDPHFLVSTAVFGLSVVAVVFRNVVAVNEVGELPAGVQSASLFDLREIGIICHKELVFIFLRIVVVFHSPKPDCLTDIKMGMGHSV